MINIAILTSGGDAPGMNACIRAVVRASIHRELNIMGVFHGYQGLIEGEFVQLNSRSVSNIIQRGGTILKTARCDEFRTKDGRKRAFSQLRRHEVEGLIVIGGDGTFMGANALCGEYDLPVIGIPATIDNDLAGTDFTIGYDTAINTVVQAVDKIRDTASSHDRLFFVEVMGRDAGLIALRSGIGVGAEAVLIPEEKTTIEDLIIKLNEDRKKKKSSMIVIVAEGEETGGAAEVARKVKEKFSYYDTRVTTLGHIQRGGSPTAMDRVLASRLGHAAVEAITGGRKGEMVGIINNEVAYTPFGKAVKHINTVNPELLKLVEILSV